MHVKVCVKKNSVISTAEGRFEFQAGVPQLGGDAASVPPPISARKLRDLVIFAMAAAAIIVIVRVVIVR